MYEYHAEDNDQVDRHFGGNVSLPAALLAEGKWRRLEGSRELNGQYDGIRLRLAAWREQG